MAPTRSTRSAPQKRGGGEEVKKRRGRPPGGGRVSTGSTAATTTAKPARITKNAQSTGGNRLSTGSTAATKVNQTTPGEVVRAKAKAKPGSQFIGQRRGADNVQEVRKRGRPVGSGGKAAKTSSANDAHTTIKKRGRPSITRDEELPAKKKRGRPSISRDKEQTSGKTGKPSKTANEDRPNRGQKKRASTHNEEHEDEPDEISEEQPQVHKYVQLVPCTRRIAQEKIDAWPLVSPQILEQMVAMLMDAKKDIVNNQRDERRAVLADRTLEDLVQRLVRQLSSSKVPPQAKDVHFNIDKLTEQYTQRLRETTKERHSKQLLKEQIKVTQRLLEKDRENLQRLERNAKLWKAEWKRQEKQGRFHPLLEDVENMEAEGDGPDDIGVSWAKTTAANTAAAKLDSPDPELAPLLEQLRRSLESMQGNHEQIAGVDDAVKNAQIALDDVLFRYASAPQYAAL